MSNSPDHNNVTIDDLKAMLADNAEALAEHLFGAPSKRSKNELRFGRKGSVSVGIAGNRRGKFTSFESGDYGSMLDAFKFAYSCSLKDAIDHAKAWLGITDDKPLPKRKLFKPVAVVNVDAEEVAKQREALRIWNGAKSIGGTPAETYLRGRAILSENWPESVRYSEEIGALVVGSTVKGKVSQIQRIFLNNDSTAKLDSDGNKIKRTLGPGHGGSVRFAGYSDSPLCLAEGPETGLSVWYATGNETWVSLGGIRADLSEVPLDRPIIICRDDDKKNAPSNKGLNSRIKEWRREGRTVLSYLPFERSRRNKADFNDALKEYGPEYVAQRLAPSNVIQMPNTMSIEEARRRLSKEMRNSIGELAKWSGEDLPPVHCMKVGLGIGKTEEAIKRTTQWVRDGNGTIVYAGPSHDLTTDLLKRFKPFAGDDLAVNIWYGRSYEFIDQDGNKTAMCQNIEAVNEVQRLSIDPQVTVCKKEDKNGTIQKCEFFDGCPYQKQRQQSADIWLMAHQMLFTEKPSAISSPSLLVIDESFYSAGLKGLEGHPIVISELQLQAPAVSAKKDMGLSADLNATLSPIRAKLSQAIQSLETGPLPRETLISAGLSSETCLTASSAEWLRMVQVNIYPNMPKALFDEEIKKASINSEIPKMAQLWKDLAGLIDGPYELSGRLSIKEIEDKKAGTRYRAIQMRGKKDIDKSWAAPTLHIDATMRMDLIGAYFPQAELRAEIDAATPFQKVVQYHDKTFGKKSIIHEDEQIRKIWTKIKAEVINKGGNWLVVLQKDIEDKIRDKYEIPDFIMLAHHNNVAGIDRWKDVSGVIVVGRTQPPPEAVAHIAGALTGEYIPPIDIEDGWYPSSSETVTAKNGQTITIDADQHPHPLAEEVRASICEDQLMQIIGRGRGVNRTAIDPVEIIVLGNVPFIEPDELREWNQPTVDEAMMAEGVLFENAEHAAAAYPWLKSAVAIRMKRQRQKDQSVTFSYINITIGKRYTLRVAQYQRAGERQKQYSALYDPRLVGDIRAYLENLVGELAYFADLEIKMKEPERETVVSKVATPDQAPAVVLEQWQDGIMPMPVISQVRNIIRATGLTQKSAAAKCGLSRPQLANVLQQRFGMSPDAVTKVKQFLSAPPPTVQESLL